MAGAAGLKVCDGAIAVLAMAWHTDRAVGDAGGARCRGRDVRGTSRALPAGETRRVKEELCKIQEPTGQ